ncbi:DUF6328 family protein [Arthrobacter sp. ATA002]|uniref:DUF6328 family protein n=1 Tax=Arthrobacter sp. ATA002 TaxID=2991715 RepID=UPI0022A7AFF6|nr:DUF6328 family protein [Arthrobacter sp. ATA002]WAP53312.1 DUF6328 family protein [Arthrobacter sp. ATA002]
MERARDERTRAERARARRDSESSPDRIDHNWTDLLNELRVLQNGVQILAGFLLTLPFQQRFAALSRAQVIVYLSLVVVSALTTAVLMSTVVMHRSFFHRRIKPDLIRYSDILLRIILILVGLTTIGTLGLVFDLVVGSVSGTAVGVGLGLVLLVLWVLQPLTLRRCALRRRGISSAPAPGRANAEKSR